MTARQPFVASPASLGRRAGAFAVDLAISSGLAFVLFVLLAIVVMGSSARRDYGLVAVVAITSYAVLAACLVAWLLVYSAMQGGRGSIGQRAFGVRLQDEVTGAPIGFWRAILRNLVWGLAGSIVVGYFTPLFDSSPRRQGWHDMAAKAVVVDKRGTDAATTAAAYAGPAANPYLAQPHAAEAPAYAGAPAYASAAPAYAAAPVYAPAAPGYAPAAPAYAAAGPAYAPATVPASAAAATHAPDPQDPFGEATAVVRRRVAAPVGVIAGVPGTAPAALGDFPGLTMPFPAATTTEPLAATATATADADLDDTRLSGVGVGAVPPPAQRAALYEDAPVLTVLTWDDGTRMAVYGRTLYGRNPAMETGAVAIAVRDETLSLSKTHFEIGGDASGPWIVDRHSTNGTVLVRDGGRIPLAPGLQTSLRAGDRLEFGDRTAAVGGA
ncbi:RDD family protein [Microbacterium sp. HD4P20]|uniref:RDD family protein n=1 Tax=Microbacterium sp. HD4P20 TaxID=2864874 RepID=UPI001C63EE8B|nr:RDD family protein [Microbacterium sp. HD4P20]MCP2635315.1 RDD family protein [Microbacterium sp. HD4P20]